MHSFLWSSSSFTLCGNGTVSLCWSGSGNVWKCLIHNCYLRICVRMRKVNMNSQVSILFFFTGFNLFFIEVLRQYSIFMYLSHRRSDCKVRNYLSQFIVQVHLTKNITTLKWVSLYQSIKQHLIICINL